MSINSITKDWEIENFLEIKNKQLCVDSISAVELAERYGTPLFVFSEQRIRHNIQRLKRAAEVINCPLKICYAAKANSNMAILRAVKDAGSDLEVNSGGELWKALKIGFRGDQLIFNGTSKETWEIENAIDAGIFAIQVDSLSELSQIADIAERLNKTANVSLRLVPEIETKTHSGLQTALLTSKFGMMPDEALQTFRQYKNSKLLNLCGVHLHIGSQNPDSAPYAEAFKMLFANLVKAYQETGVKLSHINLGGGFPVNYLRDKSLANDFNETEREMLSADFEPAEAISRAWNEVREIALNSNAQHLLENITVLLEPGRSVIGDAGICLTTVRNIKHRPLRRIDHNSTDEITSEQQYSEATIDQAGVSFETSGMNFKSFNPSGANVVWLLTDAGFNILLSMETYKWYYHLISAERADLPHNFPYKIAGPLCDGGDVYFDIEGQDRLPDFRALPSDVNVGEILALLNCGAYSIAQMFQYNGRFLPAVVLIDKNCEPKLVRKRDNLEDLISNDVW